MARRYLVDIIMALRYLLFAAYTFVEGSVGDAESAMIKVIMTAITILIIMVIIIVL